MENKRYHFVYSITNLINGKQYIGDHSTENLKDYYFGSGNLIKNAIRKYGKKNFHKKILEFFDSKEEAFNSQRKWIKKYNTLFPNGYNISPSGGSEFNSGVLSEETKKKISNSRKGMKFTDEHRKKLSESHRNKKQSIETIEKRISKTKGLKRTEEFKESLRTPKSEETKQKISDSLKGQKYSEERKKNMSISAKKRWRNIP